MRRGLVAQLTVVPVVALMLVGAMVFRTTSAAFTATTANPGNSWDAGTVTLTDNDSGSAMFSVTGMAPTDSSTQCIEVTYSGSMVPGSAVQIYAAVTETTVGGDGLGNDIDLTVSIGALGTSCALIGVPVPIYSGTLAAFNTSGSPLSTTWVPALGTDTMRPFQFTATLGADTPSNAQGEGVDADFTWSATS